MQCSSFLHPAIQNKDIMAGAPADILDPEEEGHILSPLALSSLWPPSLLSTALVVQHPCPLYFASILIRNIRRYLTDIN